MGASRMGFDLTDKFGRQNFFHEGFKWRRWHWKLMFSDTFVKFYCKLVGHIEYDADGEKACKRCQHFI